MKDRLRVVFVSRRNSLRSVLAEACLAQIAPHKFAAVSCGQPGDVAADIHPAAAGALKSASIAVPPERPKDWNLLLRSGKAAADFVITLDEEIFSAAPRWPGQPETAIWPYPDIAGKHKDGEEVAVSAIRMLYSLRRRLELLASLPLSGADRSAIRSDVRDLAHLR